MEHMDLNPALYDADPKPANVVYLPWCWRIEWVSTDGTKNVSRVMGPCEPHIARLAVASRHDDFYEFLQPPKRVRV